MPISEEYLRTLRQELLEGRSPESNKVELKSRFTDLDRLVASASAIANSPRGAGLIIIGMSEVNGDLTASTVKEHLGDKEAFHKAIRKSCKPPFDIDVYEVTLDNVPLLVLDIPASADRPHVLGRFADRENLILVRKTTGQHPANRADLDEMYAERARVPDSAPTSKLSGPNIWYMLQREFTANLGAILGGSRFSDVFRLVPGFYLRGEVELRNPGPATSIVSATLALRPTQSGRPFPESACELTLVVPEHTQAVGPPMKVAEGETVVGCGFFKLTEAAANIFGASPSSPLECEWEFTTAETRNRTTTTRGKVAVLRA